MNKLDRSYEPHLAVGEFSVLPGGEWLPRSAGWSFIQVGSGAGYWLQAQSNVELETGTVLLLAGGVDGRIRSSQLNSMSLHTFHVEPARLTGLITLDEQNYLKQATSRSDLAVQTFPPQNPIAARMQELCAHQKQEGALFRLKLLQLFVEVFDKKLEQPAAGRENADAKERLRAYLQERPPDALLEAEFDELARLTHCTPRHLSRIFHELVGMSFRDKRAEIRLTRAKELLATGRTKVLEVALESGFRSLSLFNLMFTRRFGISPGRWRQKHGVRVKNENQRNQKARRFAVC